MSTSIKATLRQSSSPKHPSTIVYRVCHHRRTATVSSGIRIATRLWDAATEQLTLSANTSASEREKRLQINVRIKNDLQRLKDIAARLEQTQESTFTAHDVCSRFRQSDNTPGFLTYVRQQAEELKQEKHFATAEKYSTALQHLHRFLHTDDIRIDNLTPTMMLRFEQWLSAQHICPNSSSAYMRSLSACYHRAISTYGMPDTHPFKAVFTGVAHTRKRAITQNDLRKIIAMKRPHNQKTALAHDIFLFSFYTRGMSLVDILFLQQNNITGHTLCYRRRKTGQWLNIHLEPCITEILKRYANKSNKSPYLFPVITTHDAEAAYLQYRHYLAAYNYQLHIIGRLLKLDTPLTGYVARHTWATAARDSGIATPIISACLGHTSERTTLIYLDSLENHLLDEANRKIIRKLKNKKITGLSKSGECTSLNAPKAKPKAHQS